MNWLADTNPTTTALLDAMLADNARVDAREAGVPPVHRCGRCGQAARFDSVAPSGEMVLYVCRCCESRGHRTFIARRWMETRR